MKVKKPNYRRLVLEKFPTATLRYTLRLGTKEKVYFIVDHPSVFPTGLTLMSYIRTTAWEAWKDALDLIEHRRVKVNPKEFEIHLN